MSKNKRIKEYLRNLVLREIERQKEIDEVSTTGTAGIDGTGTGHYDTPHAFSSKKKKKDRRNQIAKTGTNFEIVNENKLNELTDKQWTQALKHFIGNRYFPTMLKTAKSILKDRDEKRLEKFVGANYRYFKSMAKIYNLRLTEGSMDWEKDFKWANEKELKVIAKLVHMNNGIAPVIKMSKKPDFKSFIKRAAQKGLGESINEGRYHTWRNDESLTAKQKIGRSIREVRNSLTELDKTVKMAVKLKTELNMKSEDYWKNTHKALTKISERLVKMANKVGNLK
jgi:hypothetical protein